tara:strand:- start:8554 stop:9174 length:621 start_codon:yes stop_codon:yes gene_type:complete
MRSYENARGLFSFLEFLAWGGVLLGIAIIFVSMEAASRSFGGGAGLLAAMPGIAISLFSLIWVAIIQVARAGVDTAELTQQSLKVARDQLEVSKQALKQGDIAQRSFAALSASNQSASLGVEPQTAQPTFADVPTTTNATHIEVSGETEEPKVVGKFLSYKGQSGELIDGKWHLNGIAFESREKIASYIDEFGAKVSQKSMPGAHR